MSSGSLPARISELYIGNSSKLLCQTRALRTGLTAVDEIRGRGKLLRHVDAEEHLSQQDSKLVHVARFVVRERRGQCLGAHPGA